MKDLEGKVAVVTGAASGIGNAMCAAFAAAGMKLVMADIEEVALAKAAGELRDGGAVVHERVCDVSDHESVQTLADESFSHYGAVHVVCNNAGVASGGLAWEQPLAQWQWVLGVNLWGVIHGVRSFVPRMLEQGEGHVVNTASMAGLVPLPMSAPYTVSKHGVVGLSETLFFEMKLNGKPLGVSVLCPGWVNTRIGESDRNWPSNLGPHPSTLGGPLSGESGRQFMQTILSQGMNPAAVGQMVVEAVREERFWVLTHPEMSKAVLDRYQRAVEGVNPEFVFGGLVPGFE